MVDLRGTQRTFCVMLLLLQATVSGRTPPDPHFLVRAGDDVTLPSNHVNQDRCDGSNWLYSRFGSTVALVELGKIKNDSVIPEAKTNRMSLTANCSLVIRKVSGEDAGRYTNRDFDKAGRQQGADGVSELFVITMEEKDYEGLVVLSCSVWSSSECKHAAEWVYKGETTDVKASHVACEATVTFKAPLHQKSNYYQSLKCEVRDDQSGKTVHFEACSQFSCEQTGGPSGGGNVTPPDQRGSTTIQSWWRFIILGAATLLVLVVGVFTWRRSKGRETLMDVNASLRCCSSQVQHEDGDEGAVVYENVGEPSASVRLH
ncbi:uncharacterized protein LOC119195009 [Pungitius pungitius]|uniref:uncharacterized protein LOC119195009 n=1 Tax=Pungitius pungitius TaxID=134920 RepID=UPI002E119233